MELICFCLDSNEISYVCVCLRVDFHCRVIFTYVYIHVNFTHVNKIETWYEVLRLNVKLSEIKLLCVMFHTLPLFYLRT